MIAALVITVGLGGTTVACRDFDDGLVVGVLLMVNIRAAILSPKWWCTKPGEVTQTHSGVDRLQTGMKRMEGMVGKMTRLVEAVSPCRER